MIRQTTPVPNIVFDKHLPNLTLGELKVLLVIIRQTYGWQDIKTGKRKLRDRISRSQFVQKTGLSKRVVTTALASLTTTGLITVTDTRGNQLMGSDQRKGRSYIFFAFQPVQIPTSTSAENVPEPVQKSDHNKTNFSKEISTKGFAPSTYRTAFPIGPLVTRRMYGISTAQEY